MSFLVSGAPLAAAPRLQFAKTDVFTVGSNGQLSVSSVEGAGNWSQPLPISPANFAIPLSSIAACEYLGPGILGAVVFIFDVKGALHVFANSSFRGSWSGAPISPSGTAPAGACLAVAPHFTSASIGDYVEAFYVDVNGALSVTYPTAETVWATQEISVQGITQAGAFVAASPEWRTEASGALQILSTDVFLIDLNGALNVFTCSPTQGWSPAQKISADGMFSSGTRIATSRQFGAGYLGHGDQTDVFVVDNSGALWVFYKFGSSRWLTEQLGPKGLFSSESAVTACRQFGANTTDVFLLDSAATLWIATAQAASPWKLVPLAQAQNWDGSSALAACQQVGSGTTPFPGNQTDLFLIDATSALNVYFVSGSEPWQRFVVPTAAEFSGTALASNNNHVLMSNCQVLLGLQVLVTVTEDIVPIGQGGFGFQLNGYSRKGSVDVWQQFAIFNSPGSETLTCEVQCWTLTKGFNIGGSLPLTGLPNNVLPKGWQLRFILTPDALYNIASATFEVWNTTQQIANLPLDLLQWPAKNWTITEADLAPLLGFQLDIVASGGAANATLTSGAGFIEYINQDITAPLTTMSATTPATCFDPSHWPTGETSNVSYSLVPATTAGSIVQFFQTISLGLLGS
jgi:hypothetical protein